MIKHAVIISIQKKRRPRTDKVGVSIHICQVMFVPEHHRPEFEFFSYVVLPCAFCILPFLLL